MGFYPAARSHRMERQRHDDNLLIYCVDGRGHASTLEWSGQVNPGDLLLLPQGVAHRYHADPVEPWTIYWIHFQGGSTAVFNQYLGYREGGSPASRVGTSPRPDRPLSRPDGGSSHRLQYPGLHQRRQPVAPPAHPSRPGNAPGPGHEPAQLQPRGGAELHAAEPVAATGPGHPGSRGQSVQVSISPANTRR